MVRVSNKKSTNTTPAQRAILTTILYSDIFSFPLTKGELWYFLISERKISRETFTQSLQTVQKDISYKNGFYALKNRDEIIKRRKENLSEVALKMSRARFVASKLAVIPSILFIGISGGLASGNVSRNDDIDFVIITKKDTIFVSRFLIALLLQVLGVRRYRNQKNPMDTICVNLLFDETVLDFFAKYKDVYTAREITQIIPLFEREDMYQRFISANKWIQKFLPNVLPQKTGNVTQDSNPFFSVFCQILSNSFVEMIFRLLEIAWMRRHQTKETVKKHILALHPYDYRSETLRKLRLKTREFGLLTKF